MIILAVMLFAFAIMTLWMEARYSFAASPFDRPRSFLTHRAIWLIVPKILAISSAIMLLFVFKLGYAIVAVVLAAITYVYLERAFAWNAISKSVNKLYPLLLERALPIGQRERLSADEITQRTAIAKIVSLREIWMNATGQEPSKSVMETLVKKTGMSELRQFL